MRTKYTHNPGLHYGKYVKPNQIWWKCVLTKGICCWVEWPVRSWKVAPVYDGSIIDAFPVRKIISCKLLFIEGTKTNRNKNPLIMASRLVDCLFPSNWTHFSHSLTDSVLKTSLNSNSKVENDSTCQLNSEHSKDPFSVQLIIAACVALLSWDSMEQKGPLKVSATVPPIIVCRRKVITDYGAIQQKQER